MMDTKPISQEIHKGKQDVRFTEVLVFNRDDPTGGAEHKLKVSILSDSYDFQCHARVSRWDGSQWQLVHQIRNMATRDKLAYCQSYSEKDFTKDRDELLRVAGELLL
jgi:hypothetical protein